METLSKQLPSILIDRALEAYERAVAANRSSGDPRRATRAGVHAAVWEGFAAARDGIDAEDTAPAAEYHKLYPVEFEDAFLEAGGAYMGIRAATGEHHEALRAAITAAFNAGFRVAALCAPDSPGATPVA